MIQHRGSVQDCIGHREATSSLGPGRLDINLAALAPASALDDAGASAHYTPRNMAHNTRSSIMDAERRHAVAA
jgi:hypothetical protein